MTTVRSQAELVILRKLAQDLAAARKERPTSVHLLAAIASREGQAGELLRERRLDADALLKAGRSFDEDTPDPLARAAVAARELGKRAPLGEPNALHLLLALLADRTSAAHRALVQAGVDTSRLRTATMQLSLGVVAARRSSPGAAPGKTTETEPRPTAQVRPSRPLDLDKPISPAAPPRRPQPAGVTVPLFPPPPRQAPPQAKAPTAPPPAPPLAPTNTPPVATATPVPLSLPAPSRTPEQPPARRAPQASKPAPPPPPPARAPLSPDNHPLALDRARLPTLAAIGKNLTLAAALGELDKVIGRDIEVDQALDVLAKKKQNSCLLVGPAGVGKTSVARGIAHRLAAEGERQPAFARLFVEISFSELVAGTGTRGALAERMGTILREMREYDRKIILFVDEIHELVGGGFDEATAEIKLALGRGDLLLVGATSPEEYRKSFEADPALARRFSVVEIEEPDVDAAFLLCKHVALGLADHHGLDYADEAIAAAVSWSTRYLPGRALPDKALSILDLAGARARRRASPSNPLPNVNLPEIAEVVASLADIPEERLLETDRDRMLALESLLAERVVGHAPALGRIARVLRRNAAGIRAERPLGTFLLLGPTGVGKTETAKAIAEALFHSPDAMTRLDLSEYSESHATARLIGAPPGYVGHEAGGQLTEAVRRRAYQVILLDEIEKAHRDVLEAFLQVFDEGRMTDGRGRRVDFTNTVIVMTSNLGASEAGALKNERSVGFSRAAQTTVSPDKLADTMIAAARSALPPELYNRIDEVLVFGPLARAEVREVARRLLAGLGGALEGKGIRLDVEPAVLDLLLAEGGFDEGLGARPMKRAIMRLIEAPLAEMILRGELGDGSVALLSAPRGQLEIDAVPDRERSATGT
ncbi:AAA family ATPase [Polyangium aurulentum]|uniref:AAA family ATPase n=1 Tax=Polyangium aurulentum TaxID=2567896 RepID=UPI0010AE0E32|nr:ATP-dependent Clp protease ATP-binding subunit [Polyangium aurulentum]UQA60358.1 ATP-dependent Clp protease ATP-binding subunit [Polyangium aurulentum]